MLRDFFVPDNFQEPPTQTRQKEEIVYDSADLSPAWLGQFAAKFTQPAVGFERGAKAWQQRAARAWSRVAQDFRTLQFPEAEEMLAALETKTGLSRKMLQEALRNHFWNMQESVLLNWLAQVRKDRNNPNLPIAADYPELVFLVAAGNIPGVAIHPVIQLSLLGVSTLVKNASAEPFLLPAILASLERHDPQVAGRLAAFTWPRDTTALTESILALGPQLVVFGDDETVEHFEGRGEQLTGFGDRFSLALVSPLADEPKIFENLAYDICMFEQMGCLSPQAILLLTDDWQKVEQFSRELAEAMARMSEKLPIGSRTPAQHAEIQQWRGAYATRRAAGEKIVLLASAGTEWTVVAAENIDLDERVAYRFARVWPIPSINNAMSILRQYEIQLQALATSLTEKETEMFFPQFWKSDIPFTHIVDTFPGSMQRPVFGWLDQNKAWRRLTRAFIEW
ncbi:MAG: acyl-CoA reductase [candidate division KSB1 bacterium]|nr:acyl-CoA reductase [candidate division KSB1 bacterium]MDZ7305050.1 acyl-CoA reductase [candidate division KSB1 bacterium]MDZ7313817.1 acyl-CoA reductase [candidate division KSB1 bacterium]